MQSGLKESNWQRLVFYPTFVFSSQTFFILLVIDQDWKYIHKIHNYKDVKSCPVSLKFSKCLFKILIGERGVASCHRGKRILTLRRWAVSVLCLCVIFSFVFMVLLLRLNIKSPQQSATQFTWFFLFLLQWQKKWKFAVF